MRTSLEILQHDRHDLVGDDGQLRESVHIGAQHFVLPHLQSALAGGGQVQQVVDLLVVDLHVAHLHLDSNGDYYGTRETK